MPIYDYRCDACGAEFEILTLGRAGEAEVIGCPACRSGSVSRRPSRFGIAAQGSGGTAAGASLPLTGTAGGGCCGGCGCGHGS